MPSQPATPTPNYKRSRNGRQTGGCDVAATSLAPKATGEEMDSGENTTVKQRAVAYVRESTEEQGQGFSPDAQREGIRRFAPENNLELVGEYCDFHSGWRKSEARPEFQRLMADAAEGMFDVMLVYHTSRFARNQVEARRYKQLLRERLGIRVVSVTQPMGADPSDPSAFLAESIHEMFDEYYSVSLSFWTRSGLREKARQGHLVGSLPWGYVRDPATKLAAPDTERAPLVLALFERYATGQESDRSRAAWLNATGARTARNREFGKDTVREMLCNAAYAGYVSGLRDKTRAIMGLHEAIVAVKPRAAFAKYFVAANEAHAKHPKADRKSGVTKAGATGLEPATSAVTGQRSNQLSYAPVLAARDTATCVAQSIAASVPAPAAGRTRPRLCLAKRRAARARAWPKNKPAAVRRPRTHARPSNK